jgi:hypothetical protein
MSKKMKCMCLYCGLYHYIEPEGISLDETDDREMLLLRDVFCSECGGELAFFSKEDGTN